MLVVPLGRPQAAMLPCSDGSDISSFAGCLFSWLAALRPLQPHPSPVACVHALAGLPLTPHEDQLRALPTSEWQNERIQEQQRHTVHGFSSRLTIRCYSLLLLAICCVPSLFLPQS